MAGGPPLLQCTGSTAMTGSRLVQHEGCTRVGYTPALPYLSLPTSVCHGLDLASASTLSRPRPYLSLDRLTRLKSQITSI